VLFQEHAVCSKFDIYVFYFNLWSIHFAERAYWRWFEEKLISCNYLVYNEDEQCENVEWVLYPYFKTRGRKCASSWDRLNEQLIISFFISTCEIFTLLKGLIEDDLKRNWYHVLENFHNFIANKMRPYRLLRVNHLYQQLHWDLHESHLY
jgi:hypothetical protein